VPRKAALGGWPQTGLHPRPVRLVFAQDAVIAGVIPWALPAAAAEATGAVLGDIEGPPSHESREPLRASYSPP